MFDTLLSSLLIVAAAIASAVAPVSAHAADKDPLVAVVGDIACKPGDPPAASACQQAAVAKAVRRSGAKSVWLPGDIQYNTGTLADFRASFGNSWGSLKPYWRPAPGNHEYETAGASGYYDYFGADAGPDRRGYYSFNIGRWHVVSLNSNCDMIDCGDRSAQANWLRADLDRNPRRCTAAFWHHPIYSSGSEHGDNPWMRPFWKILQARRADIVLSGHDHDFEVFKRQDAFARARPYGLQEFVVGTGGRNMYAFGKIEPNSAVRRTLVFGFMAMRLRSNSYRWEFKNTESNVLASGSGRCR